MMCRVYFIFLLLSYVHCKIAPATISETLLKYEQYIKSSHDLDKSDKVLLKSWAMENQVFLVNVTSHYRLDMTRHKEHSFNTNVWLDCLSLHEKEIRKSESTYYESEKECLKVASVADNAERKAVHQVAKEIKKWRKSYRYLANQCHQDNPGNEEAVGLCLVEYMQRDNFDIAFQRLINLKHKAMGDLYLKMVYASFSLEECLKSSLSQYLNTVRSIMDNLNICYDMKNKNSAKYLVFYCFSFFLGPILQFWLKIIRPLKY
ncbi:uncharacterized protein LOC123695175 [Colias croceus]|uniref:uncharacterized protein LOC123695175 n=1 Tax=Colias crocea TaxID=72248 RepID=UPI001E27C6AE|nr:uncharacterized protein LOC123695175 [Colias croceus]